MHRIVVSAVCGMANVVVRALYVRPAIEMARARSLEAEPGRVPGSEVEEEEEEGELLP